MGKGTVLPQVRKSKPVPILVHTRDRIVMVLPIPVSFPNDVQSSHLKRNYTYQPASHDRWHGNCPARHWSAQR